MSGLLAEEGGRKKKKNGIVCRPQHPPRFPSNETLSRQQAKYGMAIGSCSRERTALPHKGMSCAYLLHTRF